MKPNTRFANLEKTFWANIRLMSQYVGYTERRNRKKLVPETVDEASTNSVSQPDRSIRQPQAPASRLFVCTSRL